jgi:hypothetical protein
MDDFDGRLVLELFDQRSQPAPELFFILAEKDSAHGRQMLHRMIIIQALAGLGKTIIGQTPNPDRPVANDQRSGGLS